MFEKASNVEPVSSSELCHWEKASLEKEPLISSMLWEDAQRAVDATNCDGERELGSMSPGFPEACFKEFQWEQLVDKAPRQDNWPYLAKGAWLPQKSSLPSCLSDADEETQTVSRRSASPLLGESSTFPDTDSEAGFPFW